MPKIYGDKATIERARTAKPGDPHVYVNMEAIMELPDQFEVHIGKVTFDFEKDFSDLRNGTYMPSTELMNDIAEARGIDGTNEIKMEPIIAEVDVNPMLCKPITDTPTMRKMIVGKRVIKTGRVMNEDGTWRTSDPCAVDYNVWERCCIDWAKEEEYTVGYTKNLDKLRYDNQFKRQRHFAEEMKFAQRKADTKARNVVTRVLACLKTGYKKDELKDGYMIFPRIRLSREYLKMRAAAELQAVANGMTDRGDRAKALLFGPDTEPTISMADAQPVDDAFPVAQKEVSKRDHMRAILKTYRKDELINEALKVTADKIIGWLDTTENAEQDATYWPKALNIFKQIEDSIPQEMRIDHKIF